MLPSSSMAASTTAASGLQVSDNEALIESCFRRLLSAVEAEREKIRNSWSQIDSESSATSAELERLRTDTEEWCHAQRNKIEMEWKRLDKLRERMAILWPVGRGETLEINCSGYLFAVPKVALCSVEGSMLNHMFSDAFVQSIPRDAHGRFFLDFNPVCFSIIVDFLEARMERGDAPVPPIPPEQQQNMDLLAETLKLKPFLRDNRVLLNHATSLNVQHNVIESTHSGWQVISSEFPLFMAHTAYFEVTILTNPDTKDGGLAVGVCGHIPNGKDIYTICIPDAVIYNSGKGLVGSNIAIDNVAKGVRLDEGSVLGVKSDVYTNSLAWYFNGLCIGTCWLKPENLETMRVLYPVFGLMTEHQRIEVDFKASGPKPVRAVTDLAVTE